MVICANQCFVFSVPKEGSPSDIAIPTPDSPFVRSLCAFLAVGPKSSAALSAGPGGGGHVNSGYDTDSEVYDLDTPYELRALEVALGLVTRGLDLQTFEEERFGYPAIESMAKEVSNESLEEVRGVKERLGRFTARVERMKSEIEKILGDDADLADLYLSRRAEQDGTQLPAQPRSSSSVASDLDSLSGPTDDVEAGRKGRVHAGGQDAHRALYRKTSLVLTTPQLILQDGRQGQQEGQEVLIGRPLGGAAFIDQVRFTQTWLQQQQASD